MLAFGLLLGMRHALDPDHVAAVTALAARPRRSPAWLLGAAWGVGHMGTIAAVGLALTGFKIAVPDRVGLLLEAGVGVMLVLLGVLNLAGRDPRTLGVPFHTHPHEHGDPEHRHDAPDSGETHAHPHTHGIELRSLRSWLEAARAPESLRAALVGLVHGLAGSAAVALLAAAVLPDVRWAFLYLLVFGLGNVAGMTLLTVFLERSMTAAARRWLGADRSLAVLTGLMSAGIGLRVLWENLEALRY